MYIYVHSLSGVELVCRTFNMLSGKARIEPPTSQLTTTLPLSPVHCTLYPHVQHVIPLPRKCFIFKGKEKYRLTVTC